MSTLSAREASAIANTLYANAPGVPRKMQSLRPYICPFGDLVDLVPADSQVLDVGCGAGLFLALLAYSERLVEGVGYDINPRSLEVARAMNDVLRRRGTVSLRFELGTPGSSLPNGVYDVVSMIDVLHHVPPAVQRDAVLGAAEKVRPGGLLIYKDIGRRPLWRATANRLHDLLVAREWIHYCPIKSVESWLTQAGFKLLRASSHYLVCYHHELRVFEKCSTESDT